MAVTTGTATTVFGQDTLPKLFRHVVRERGDRVAMREKDLGVWRAVSWRQYGERARHVGLGLVALGLRHRDVVSIMADNCPEWLYADMGTLSVGGVTNGIYTTDSPRQVEYIVNDSGTRFFFAEPLVKLERPFLAALIMLDAHILDEPARIGAVVVTDAAARQIAQIGGRRLAGLGLLLGRCLDLEIRGRHASMRRDRLGGGLVEGRVVRGHEGG